MENKALKSMELFGEKPVWTAIFTMAVPSCITILVMVFYNMADMFFIGRLGDTSQVAAVSIVSPVFSLAAAAATMLGIGGSSMIAKTAGEGKIQDAKAYGSLCFYAAIIIGVLCTGIMLTATQPLLHLLGANEDTLGFAGSYMRILALGAPMMILSVTLAGLLRADGAIKEGLLGNLAGTVLNIILDPLFIFGFHMGITGAAAATVIANTVITLYYTFYIMQRGQVLSLRPELAVRRKAALLHIFAVGLPNGISSILSGFAGTFSNNLLKNYGTDAIAAMAAAGKATMIIAMLQMGICMGVQPMLAYNYGAGNISRTKEIIKKLCILTFVLGLAAACGCILVKHTLVGLFLQDAAASQMGEKLVTFLVIASPVIGLYYLGTNFLQASGNVAAATLVSLLRQGILLIPALFLMNYAAGFIGIALAYTLADVLATAAAVFVSQAQYKRWEKDTGIILNKENPSEAHNLPKLHS